MGYKTVEGRFEGKGRKFALVASRFNEFVTKPLIEGAVDTFVRHGVKEEDITLYRTPGAFELPLVCKKVAELKQYNAVIALGAVIRGSTPHFDYVANEAAKGIAAASMETGVPIIFGVLTTDTIEQAVERAGTKAGNKGADAAMSALEMASLVEAL